MKVRVTFTVLLLLLAHRAFAGSYGVALLVVNNEHDDTAAVDDFSSVAPLAQALTARGFATTVKKDLSRDELRFSVAQAAKTAPTHGVVLIYFVGGLEPGEGKDTSDVYLTPVAKKQPPYTTALTSRKLGARDVVKYLAEDSGASISYVLLDGASATPDVAEQRIIKILAQIELRNRVHLGFAAKGLSQALVLLLADKRKNPVTAIHAAATEAGGWTSSTPGIAAPDLLSPHQTSDSVTEGNRAGAEWVNALGMVFVWCPQRAGVSVGDNAPGFWLGKYEVTKREVDLVTPRKPRGALAFAPNHPRDAMRYDDIMQFIEELNRRERFFERLPDDWEYALPTKDQWEYASRAGGNTRYYSGSSIDNLSHHANFADRSLLDTADEHFNYADGNVDDGYTQIAPVGSYLANPWGFHDMYGNLWEWIASDGDNTDQRSPIAKGCSWVSIPDYCHSDFEHHFSRETEENFIGFRLALRRIHGQDKQ